MISENKLQTPMKYKNLTQFIDLLKIEGELKRVNEFVSPSLEITEVTDRVSKNSGPALLFENTGTQFPVLINSMGSEQRMALALGVESLSELDDRVSELSNLLKKKELSLKDKLGLLLKLKSISNWLPGKYKGHTPPCREVIQNAPDLNKLPILKCWPYDGGKFITLPVVHTLDPVTGERNAGMYRMQVFDGKTTGMHWHIHKDSANHYRKYKELGKKMPVVVTLGGDPAYTYAATSPLPENIDEYIFAGFLRNHKVKMTRALTQDMYIPADVDFVIEGYVDPAEELVLEGPFGDHTGFYSLEDYYPVFHVTAITHRKNAVYPATIVGIPPQEDAYIGKATERIFLHPLKMTISPDIIDISMPAEGVFHNLVIIKIKKAYPGQSFKVMNALWGAGQMMFSKVLVVVGDDVNIHNYSSVAEAVLENTDFDQDLHFSKGPADILDHASRQMGMGTKIGIDATNKNNPSKNSMKLGNQQNLQTLLEGIQGIKNIHIFDGLPLQVTLMGVSKNNAKGIHILKQKLIEQVVTSSIKIFIILDDKVDLHDWSMVLWIILNNIDPMFDIEIQAPFLFIDATSKYGGDFKRDWPNVVVMDEPTIKKIDKLWQKLSIGKFLESPSLKYNKLNQTPGASVMSCMK